MEKNNKDLVGVQCNICLEPVAPHERFKHMDIHKVTSLDIAIYNIFGYADSELLIPESEDGYCPICNRPAKVELFDNFGDNGYASKLLRCSGCDGLFFSSISTAYATLVRNDKKSFDDERRCTNCIYCRVSKKHNIVCNCEEEFDSTNVFVGNIKDEFEIANCCAGFKKKNKRK